MRDLTMAEIAVDKFNEYERIENDGQTVQRTDAGDVHLFPDGSAALHWHDGAFTVGEPVED